MSRKNNELTDYLEIIAGNKWIALKAHKASRRGISIHKSTNANITVNKHYWLKLSDGEKRKMEDLRRILPLFIERQLIVTYYQ